MSNSRTITIKNPSRKLEEKIREAGVQKYLWLKELCSEETKPNKVMKTREEALRRFKAAKQKKMNAVAALEEKMKQAYEERTGMKANYVVTL